MVMMGLEFVGEVPFHEVYIHSVIQAADGRRMSKSLGTGVDPLDLIDGGPRPPVFKEGGEFPAYGADAVRFGLLLMSSSQDVRFSEEKVAMGRNFANKLWNAARLVLLATDGVEAARSETAGSGTSASGPVAVMGFCSEARAR
jgi:valyl-tRNA synthetase